MSHDVDEPWYSARCVFRMHGLPVSDGKTVYEERIILIRAETFDVAAEKADSYARQYALENDCEYLQYTDIYHLYEERIDDGSEVYSLMRTCDLAPESFMSRYFSDGTEHVRDLAAD